MKKQILEVAVVVFMLFCLNLSGIRAEAAGPRDGEVVDGSLLTSDLEAIDKFEPIQRWSLLGMGISAISNKGNGLLYICAETFCVQTSDRVKAYIYLERLVGDEWEPVTQRAVTEKNTYYVRNGINYVVEEGTYYRVRGSHVAIYQNDSESCYTVTNGLYID